MTARCASALLACALLTSGPAPRSATAAPAPPPAEVRGLWVVRTALVSPPEVDRVVDDAAEAGFNALFVQVRGRGDAFYRSALVPRSPLLERQPREFDPLARLLARAHARRLSVHAWVNVLLAAHFGQPLPPGHVLGRHPEWAMVPKSAATAALVAGGVRRLQLIMDAGRAEGDVEGYYLSPSVAAVGVHLEAVVRELVGGYAVDGLHLDFVRYPGPAYDHSASALHGFHAASRGDLLGAPARDPVAWDAYRREVLTRLVTRLADAGRATRPGLLVSAAVTPDEAQAVHHKGQDWPRWLESRLVAVVCPMAYTPEERTFQQQLEVARARAGDGQRVWAGIGAYRLDPAEL
ncbi:MAG TPA: family 10 glycosylhydrolase, partial [Vicinamibacteria bacterium]|nr:family 10 glycosylhydrolase [Vicinamibacteria bacterium]